MIPNNMRALAGAIHWLSRAQPLELVLCPIQRLRMWASTTERCSDEEIRREIEQAITLDLVRWYMPGVLTLTPVGRRVATVAVSECSI